MPGPAALHCALLLPPSPAARKRCAQIRPAPKAGMDMQTFQASKRRNSVKATVSHIRMAPPNPYTGDPCPVTGRLKVFLAEVRLPRILFSRRYRNFCGKLRQPRDAEDCLRAVRVQRCVCPWLLHGRRKFSRRCFRRKIDPMGGFRGEALCLSACAQKVFIYNLLRGTVFKGGQSG